MTGAEPRGPDRAPAAGWVDESLREEFPALGVVELSLDAVPGRSPRAVRQRLKDLSSRFRGPTAVTMRQDPVPWAYRVFFRHIGLDPDQTRTPVEAAALERLLRGEFRSHNRVDDALTIAVIETGVPIWALDSATVQGPLGVRPARGGERLGRDPAAAMPLTAGRLVVADADAPLAVLFGEVAPGHGVTTDTRRMTMFAVRVAGVPEIHVEEALWTCAEVLDN
jgi:DNA/RNA-binding domain of Phe-tRNA-synthetase-like protein